MSEDIAKWLGEHGFGKYIDVFEVNEIGVCDLPLLTEDHLRELGLPMGPRMRLMAAIGKGALMAEESYLEALQPPDNSGATLVQGEAERRQLTVMFCDLVGSTALSQQLDPEDLREINRTYQDACKLAIESYEGYVARYMGDGVLAYFGWPGAHEDDAVRAIHAGLGVVDSLGGIRTGVHGVELRVRVGIATGPVVVGDMIGEGASQESAVVGETPNLAARLQALAAPGTVVVARGTHALAGGQFEYESLGKNDLEGIVDPVDAWRVIGPIHGQSRFAAIRRTGLTPMVGRQHEIGLLLGRWEQASEGDGQVVLLSGEAGIGKSRVTEALREKTMGESSAELIFQCSPYGTNSALHPVIEQLGRAARFNASDTSETKLDKLEALNAQSSVGAMDSIPLFAALLSVPAEERYSPLNMAPERQKQATLAALVAHIEGLSRDGPVLMIFEDAHWADPTSLELLGLVIAAVQRAPVLVLITLRPEFSPPWSGHTHVTTLTLNRFTRSLVMAMVAEIAGDSPLPGELCQHILEMTDGVPLFVEELTKTILKSGLRDVEPDRHGLGGGSSRTAIPSTLHDSLMARLDRLSDGKQVAQTGAVIGREFSRALLESVCGLPPDDLDEAIGELRDAGLVFTQGIGTDATYIFKHALIQEAAYESLLLKVRRTLHSRIADALLDRFADTAQTRPELIAHHLTEAGRADAAIDYWLQAGRRAVQRAANLEAIGHLRTGLDLLLGSPESTARARRELVFQLELGGPYLSTRGWGADETTATFVRARELCSLLGETVLLPPVLYGEYMRELSAGNCQVARAIARELFHFGEAQDQAEAVLQGRRLLSWSTLYLGEFSKSRAHADAALGLYVPEKHAGLKLRYGNDTRVAVLCARAVAECLCGYSERANETSETAIACARGVNHEPTLAYALILAGALPAALQQDPARAADFGKEAVDVARRLSSAMWLGFGRVMCGWSACMLESDGDHLQLFRTGLHDLESAAPNPWQPIFLSLLAEIHVRLGDTDRALRVLEDALYQVGRTGERSWEAGIHHLLGKTLLDQNAQHRPQAEASFRMGIRVAESQGAKTLELRSATSLARLWQSQGKSREARELLRPVYDWFTEGFDTADLNSARVLLDQLS